MYWLVPFADHDSCGVGTTTRGRAAWAKPVLGSDLASPKRGAHAAEYLGLHAGNVFYGNVGSRERIFRHLSGR